MHFIQLFLTSLRILKHGHLSDTQTTGSVKEGILQKRGEERESKDKSSF